MTERVIPARSHRLIASRSFLSPFVLPPLSPSSGNFLPLVNESEAEKIVPSPLHSPSIHAAAVAFSRFPPLLLPEVGKDLSLRHCASDHQAFFTFRGKSRLVKDSGQRTYLKTVSPLPQSSNEVIDDRTSPSLARWPRSDSLNLFGRRTNCGNKK